MGLLDRLFGTDEETARGRQLDAALQAENERDRERYGENWYAQTQANLNRPATVDSQPAYNVDASAEVNQAFDDEWAAGVDRLGNAATAPLRVVGDIGGSILSKLPWWVWVGLLAVGYYYARPFIGPLLKAAKRK